jgi:ribosome biogenesis GTPase
MLSQYGWSEALRQQFEPFAARELVPARVTVQKRGLLTVATDEGELTATLAGRFVHDATLGGHPVAGDWVAVALGGAGAIVHAVVPRRTAFVRRAADSDAGQVVAANADVALLVVALTRDLNVRRIERYLALAWSSGAQPVIVLTKADLCPDLGVVVPQVEAIAFGVQIITVSAVTGSGLDDLRGVLEPGATAVLLGSSGAGKSTLVNVLAGAELMPTQSTRADDRGRHTTTHRELILLPSGALLLDTPGMREVGLVATTETQDAFADVEELALECRFRDCGHEAEPDCAVRAALDSGVLAAERYASYVKLERERAYLERRDDPLKLAAERGRWKAIHKTAREALREKGQR